MNVQKQDEGTTLALEAGLGFLGGLLLNLMPCVLPVIGLKIFSFVEQAGQNRRTAMLLNVWYSAGLIAVFLVLATLAVTGSGWGGLFQQREFNIVMAVIVFAMALSFLGVWEFPIPGFAGGSSAQSLAKQEGFTGAFFKGVITTLLATPCIGPLMGGSRCLGTQSAGDQHLCGLHQHRAGHGEPVPADRSVSRPDAFPS